MRRVLQKTERVTQHYNSDIKIINIKEKHKKEMEILNLQTDKHRKAMAMMDAFSKMCNVITSLVENKENIPSNITNLLK